MPQSHMGGNHPFAHRLSAQSSRQIRTAVDSVGRLVQQG